MSDLHRSPISAVVAAHLADAEQDVRVCEDLYQRGSRIDAFWALTDLRSSAGYRVLAGDQQAYVRAEIFVRILRRLYGHYRQVDVFKELGDGVLLTSDELRPLVEVVSVYDALSRLWAVHRGRWRDISLKASTVITFGAATRLERAGGVDYVGQPLDRLARVASQDHRRDALCLIEDDALARDRRLGGEDYPFLSVDGPHLVSESKLKPGEQPIRYWRLRIDPSKFVDFRQHFQPLREDFRYGRRSAPGEPAR